MEENLENENQTQYTLNWLWLRLVFIIGVATVCAMIAAGINSLSENRMTSELLSVKNYEYFEQTTAYCFAIIMVSLVTLTLIEVIFHKNINLLQYGLIGAALCLFFLLLLSFSEQISFIAAYATASVMTIALISVFVRAITSSNKALIITSGTLAVEYAAMFMLVRYDTQALLVGSLLMFAIIALIMYFTIKLRVENNQLTLT